EFLKAVPWKRLSEACEGYCLSEASKGYIKVHDGLRKWLHSNVSPAVSESTRIIYGGSTADTS
ncbi:unnamed protein product, partial [Urochloa humidicola]